MKEKEKNEEGRISKLLNAFDKGYNKTYNSGKSESGKKDGKKGSSPKVSEGEPAEPGLF